jgi:hypothetical protein
MVGINRNRVMGVNRFNPIRPWTLQIGCAGKFWRSIGYVGSFWRSFTWSISYPFITALLVVFAAPPQQPDAEIDCVPRLFPVCHFWVLLNALAMIIAALQMHDIRETFSCVCVPN